MIVKVFNLMSRVNETKSLVQDGSCEGKCTLNKSTCNSKQRWNHGECLGEGKELHDWNSCKDDRLWNPLSVIMHAKLKNF